MEQNDSKPHADDTGSGKVDLKQLQSLDFGPDWTQRSEPSPGSRDKRRDAPRGKPGDRDAPRPARPRKDRRPGGPSDSGRRERRPVRESRPFTPTAGVQFVPEESGFEAICHAMRQSCRTYELFEIARLILAKPERYLVEVRSRPREEGGETPALFVSVPDDLPFETEEDAINHVMQHHLDGFFETEEVEVDPPKGNFQYVCRCTLTGELLAPPNYHRYAQILAEHHARRLPDVSFEKFKANIETLRDEESVNAWLESMKKRVRYTFKQEVDGERPHFDATADARAFLLRQCRNRVVRTAKTTRFPGTKVEAMPEGDIRRSIETVREAQKRFPLETANGLRGRLRRHKFHIYKKGSHGVSFVCAVRRNFRRPDQVFAESVASLLRFLDENPMIHASRLPEAFLGIAPSKPSGDQADGESGAASTPPPDDPRVKKLSLDLRWLLTEGYVTEYSDGRLFAQPPLSAEEEKKPRKDSGGKDSASAGMAASEDAAPSGSSEPETSGGSGTTPDEASPPAQPESGSTESSGSAPEGTGEPAQSEPEGDEARTSPPESHGSAG